MDQLSLAPFAIGGGSGGDDSGGGAPDLKLVHRSKNTAIYRLNDIGYKLLLDDAPSEEHIAKFMHEQSISNTLPSTCHKRQTIGFTNLHNRPALSFKWANGITLKEWLQNASSQASDLDVRLRAAMAIAKSLAAFHDGGVAYNNLTPENIVLSPFEGSYVATLIDLSNCINIGMGNNNHHNTTTSMNEAEMKGGDLNNLGLVLDKLFRGKNGIGGQDDGISDSSNNEQQQSEDTDENYAENARKKRGRQNTMLGGDDDIPLYLGTIISALIGTESLDHSDFCYKNANDVFHDLQTMAKNTNGCFLKCKVDESTANSRLVLQGSNLFYGRQVQMSMLMHLFTTMTTLGDEPTMATIAGYAGTGKTTLVNQMKKPLEDVKGSFIEGKFDSFSRPDIVLSSALNSFFGKILESDSTKYMSMKWRIHDAIGSGSNEILLHLLPNLQTWMFDDSTSDDDRAPSSKVIGSSHRLKFLFCKLISAIACRDNPLILVLDDLQWADEMTLDVIRMVMTDPDIGYFLLVGCYRDNEVNMSHPLMVKLRAIQERGISITPIKVGPIGRECANTMVSEKLCLPPSLSRPFSSVVHGKTGGIVMFIMRFLASLNNEGDLSYSMSHRRWVYDLKQVSMKEIRDDVVTHMTEQMKGLSREMRMGLKAASCLGFKFHGSVIEKIKSNGDIEDTFLASCVEFGFLRNEGDYYIWAHDQIQQAAYDLIPLNNRDSFHLLIGSRLFMNTGQREMKNNLFLIVDNMNHGVMSNLIDNQDQKDELSQLNLDAGENALRRSAFQSAAKYLLNGLSLLSQDSWQRKYDLTLSLHDAISEALYVTGDFAQLSALSSSPLAYARSFEDKLNINNNLVRALAANGQYEAGIKTCASILAQLGEVIPTEVNAGIYMSEVAQVKQLLIGRTREELLSLPMMTETRKLAVMQFLNHALTSSYQVKPMLNPILVFRMVKMTILHGIYNVSCFAFACYSAWLVTEPTFDVEGGHFYSRVALDMMKKIDAVEMIPRVYSVAYAFTNIYKEPWQAILSKHLEAYECGMASGDVEFALTNTMMYAYTAVYGCGENLEKCCEIVLSYAQRAFQLNHRNIGISIAAYLQTAMDLRGVKENVLSLFVNGLTEESCFLQCQEKNELAMCRMLCMMKKYTALYLGELDTAANAYEICQKFILAMGPTGCGVSHLVTVFIDGLIGFFFARKHREEDEAKWTTIGNQAIQSLRKWKLTSEWNFSNKCSLLEAEYYFLMGDDERAVACYNASIKAAREHRFIHEEGLGEEKFATYLLEKNQHDNAMSHFVKAKRCYEAWGAQSIVDRIDKAIAILLPLCRTSFPSR